MSVFDVEVATVADGDGGFDHHHGVGVDAEDEVDHVFDAVGVEVIFDRVVVGGGGDDDEVGVAVCLGTVEGGSQVEILFSEVFLDIFVLMGDLRELISSTFSGITSTAVTWLCWARSVAMERPT